MKVSICVPIYGVEKYIERCVQSLFEQTYGDIEYIFIDDCSPDKSIPLLLNALDHYPNRKEQVKVVRHERNRGLAAARNTAIKTATGEFIMHVDSDDWVDKNLVEALIFKQKENDADIVSADGIAYYPGFKKTFHVLHTTNSRTLALKTIDGTSRTQVWGRIIRKSLYINNNIWVEEGVNMAEDYQVISRLIYYAQNVNWIDNVFYHYINLNPSSYTYSFSKIKFNQAVRSCQIVYDFFEDKGEDFVETCKASEFKTWFNRLKNYLLADEDLKDVGIYIKNRIKSFDGKYMFLIPLYLRLAYFLPLNVAKRYIRTLRMIKRQVRRM